MALRNPKLFGLNVLSFFADVENKTQALQALNLPPLDLEVIAGSSDAGAEKIDAFINDFRVQKYGRGKQPPETRRGLSSVA